ncbi:unnamed protein product [Rhodiola kirilowii]
MVSCEESERRSDHPFLGQSDPVVLEINRLENQLKDRKRELGDSQSEIKALKATEAAKDRALEELENEVNKLDERLRAAENVLDQKNLEVNKLVNEKKDALAAQFAAEATLRRVYANTKDSDSTRVESFIAPLEAENKIYKNEITALQEDKKTLERVIKSKELALLEAEKILKMALERALIVEEVQNQNIDLRRQIEICLEENKILDKTVRQKVVEVEKLSQTVRELEEAILAGGSAANTVRDCQRQISELNEEKRVLERELARARVAANRVAATVANEWKDETDKVMPVKQWLDERKLLQAEMQRLRDKLTVSERTAKAESQLKEKLQLRLKTLEDGLKRASSIRRWAALQQPNGNIAAVGELMATNSFRTDALIKNFRASTGKAADTFKKESIEENSAILSSKFTVDDGFEAKQNENRATDDLGNNKTDGDDIVSGFLYDSLQKEVISLRKLCDARECLLNSKDEEIKMLMRKVDALTKSIEVESRKMKREIMARGKEAVLPKADDNKRNRNLNVSKRPMWTGKRDMAARWSSGTTGTGMEKRFVAEWRRRRKPNSGFPCTGIDVYDNWPLFNNSEGEYSNASLPIGASANLVISLRASKSQKLYRYGIEKRLFGTKGRKEKLVSRVIICDFLKSIGIIPDEIENSELPSSVEVMRERVEFFQKLGLSIDDMNEYPLMLGCSLRKNVIPVLGYLEKIGIPRQKFGEFIRHYPQVLHASVVIELVPVVKFLRGLDVEKEDIGFVLQKYPEILGFKTEGTMSTSVAYLVSIGVNPRDIGPMVTQYPYFLGMRVGTVIKPLVDYLVSLGLPKKILVKMLEKRPYVLGYNLEETIKPNVEGLLSFGVRKEAIPSVILQYPEILGLPLKAKLYTQQYFLNLKLKIDPGQFAQVVERMPQIVSLNQNVIMMPINFLLARGIPAEDVAKMVVKCPQLVSLQIPFMKNSYYFFKSEMGRHYRELVEFPEYLTYNLESRIKPRYQKLRSKEIQSSLAGFLNCSDQRFEEQLKARYIETDNKCPSFYMGGKLELPGFENVSNEEDVSDDEIIYRRTVSL